jgi:CHAD domain-containing protein
MRVATRRLREAIHLLGSKELRRHELAVKRLQDALGAVRDAQLLGAWLRQHRLQAAAKDRTRELHRTSRALGVALMRWKDRTAPALLDGIANEKRSGKLGGKKVARRVRKRLDSLLDRMEPVLLAPRPAPAHALRKSVKKLRYATELAEPGFPILSKLEDALEPLQEALGDLHDVDVRIALVRHSASQRLLEGEREARAGLADKLLECLAAFRDSGVAKKVRKAL